MIEKSKKNVDSKGCFGALLTDLSEAFNCIPHELMIEKLEAYGFDLQLEYSSSTISVTENKESR